MFFTLKNFGIITIHLFCLDSYEKKIPRGRKRK